MYDYKDVYIKPQFSDILTRKQVDTSVVFDDGLKINVPVMSANMDTVTDGKMALAMYKAGGIGAIHRFMSVEQNIDEFLVVKKAGGQCFVSIGVNEESLGRFDKLFEYGARYFIIDIAHGHSIMMRNTVSAIRARYGNVPYIMGGNVASPEGVKDLLLWGCDAVKVGIGPGNVCLTKNVTGVTVPQFTAVMESTKPGKIKYKNSSSHLDKTVSGRQPLVVADGGVSEIGDIAKALGAGADLVMCGRLFAECSETPGPRVNGQKVYRGMASRDAMLTIRDSASLPTPEGKSVLIDASSETSATEVVKHIQGGLQSAFSYTNARNLIEFGKKCQFGYRR